MSKNDEGPLDRTQLLTYAIASIVRDEIERQGLKNGWVAERSGVPARTLTGYLNGHTPGVPMDKWAAVARPLGFKGSEILTRAEDRLEALSETDVDLLLRLEGPAAVMVLTNKGKNHRNQGRRPEDPPQAPGEGRRSA